MTTQKTIGRHFLVAQNEREIFLGRALDDGQGGRIALEGKTFAASESGLFTAKPFTTRVEFPTAGAALVQRIESPEAADEAERLLAQAIPTVHGTNFPLLYRWFDAAPAPPVTGAFDSAAATNPFEQFSQGFETTAERFRRALFTAPQITTTRELDRLTELEGDLSIELGKVTNDVAVRFNAVLTGDAELSRFFEQLGAGGIALVHGMAGWSFVMSRLHTAKSWARTQGKTPLVREINALTKEGISRINDVLLEHASALDTLISETFGQFGIAGDPWGEISPFAAYTGSAHARRTPAPTAQPVGV